MAFSYTLKVSEEDIESYLYSLKRDIKILKYWKQILKRMPKVLLDEVSAKSTKLNSKSDSNYFFKTDNASQELELFLNKFEIKVI
jgi:hypothetical protein